MGNIYDVYDKDDDKTAFADENETDINDCVKSLYRDIYKGGFPNCVATVEDGSWCGSNDACTLNAIRYTGMEDCAFADCSKAWK